MSLVARLEPWATRLAAASALLGGAVLLAVIAVTVASVVGRAMTSLGLGPVPGDAELAEMGAAVAIFAFLPWCQLRGGQVTVDIFTDRLPRPIRAGLDALGNALLTLVYAGLAWRLAAGLADKQQSFESSFILGVPLWWPYALCLAAAIAAVPVGLFTALRSTSGEKPA